MSESSVDDIQIDFISELQGYIPALRDKASRLKENPVNDSDSDLSELHRLVHTIRGASSLVKLNNLSAVASEFEEVLAEFINCGSSFDTEVVGVMNQAIDFLDAYAKEVPCNDTFNPELRTEILEDLQNVRKSSVGGETEDLLSQLLKCDDQNEEGQIGIDSDPLVFEDIDLDADHLVAGEDELADMAGYGGHDDDAYLSASEVLAEDGVVQNDTAANDTNQLEAIDLPQQELLEGFYQEAEDHFQDLGAALGKLEELINAPVAPTPDHKELIRIIRRSVHTVKGAAAVVKLKSIAAWGHEFEDVLDWLYEEADRFTPEDIRVIADAADLLERFVSSPQKVDPAKANRLRDEFKRIIGLGLDNEHTTEATTAHMASLLDTDEAISHDGPQELPIVDEASKRSSQTSTLGLDQVQTLRVDKTKVDSLVNLAGELNIALSAFDQDMDGLGSLIAEIDRARSRLKQTARDLELGYEVKAIRQLGAASPSQKDSMTAGGEQEPSFSDFDALELDRYSELNLIIRSLSETAVDVSTISHQLSNIYGGFDSYLNRLRILFSDLNEKSMRMRMTPMSTIINRLRRTVRETAAQLDKKVQLTIHGEQIELDKMVWDKLADPLMHLLRNAIDHGIETKAARQAAGKPENAVIHLEAAYRGNQVVIRVTDDGASLDYEAIRRALAASHPEKDMDAIGESDLADMIFQSGFSTRQTISEVSGRGVGLDVVRANILELKGSVRVEKSAPGTGTTFRINLPLTMAVMHALLFDVGGQRYATSLYDIKEIRRVDPKSIEGQGEKTVEIDGRSMPFYRLSELLVDVAPKAPVSDSPQWPLVLIVDTEFWQGAVAIDHMYNQREIVIKSLGTHLRHVKGIAGATVMGDGMVLPILNLEELLRMESAHHLKSRHLKSKTDKKVLEIMVVDDSVSVRTVVARLMQRQGWQVLTAKDGVEAIEILHARQPDLIVLDVEMPRMNGYEFMSSLRVQERFKDLPVIMLTSRASEKHRTKAQALGVNGFVTKPYDDEEFVDLVDRLSGHKDTYAVTRN